MRKVLLTNVVALSLVFASAGATKKRVTLAGTPANQPTRGMAASIKKTRSATPPPNKQETLAPRRKSNSVPPPPGKVKNEITLEYKDARLSFLGSKSEVSALFDRSNEYQKHFINQFSALEIKLRAGRAYKDAHKFKGLFNWGEVLGQNELRKLFDVGYSSVDKQDFEQKVIDFRAEYRGDETILETILECCKRCVENSRNALAAIQLQQLERKNALAIEKFKSLESDVGGSGPLSIVWKTATQNSSHQAHEDGAGELEVYGHVITLENVIKAAAQKMQQMDQELKENRQRIRGLESEVSVMHSQTEEQAKRYQEELQRLRTEQKIATEKSLEKQKAHEKQLMELKKQQEKEREAALEKEKVQAEQTKKDREEQKRQIQQIRDEQAQREIEAKKRADAAALEMKEYQKKLEQMKKERAQQEKEREAKEKEEREKLEAKVEFLTKRAHEEEAAAREKQKAEEEKRKYEVNFQQTARREKVTELSIFGNSWKYTGEIATLRNEIRATGEGTLKYKILTIKGKFANNRLELAGATISRGSVALTFGEKVKGMFDLQLIKEIDSCRSDAEAQTITVNLSDGSKYIFSENKIEYVDATSAISEFTTE